MDRRPEKIDDVCREAVNQWGEFAQITKTVEELSELIAALAKFDNTDDREAVIDELADVSIMLRQMQLCTGVSDEAIGQASTTLLFNQLATSVVEISQQRSIGVFNEDPALLAKMWMTITYLIHQFGCVDEVAEQVDTKVGRLEGRLVEYIAARNSINVDAEE